MSPRKSPCPEQSSYEILLSLIEKGEYVIDETGRVFHCLNRRNGKKIHTRVDYTTRDGYRNVVFQYERKTRNCRAHKLIWMHLRGPVPKGLEINHIDGDRQNNVVTNLEVVTPKENMHHAIHVLGTKKVYVTTNPNARLKLRDIARIFWWRGHGMLIREIAARLSTTKRHVTNILKRRHWRYFI